MDSEVQRLYSRANSLVTKFKQGGGRSDIEEAIAIDREALQLCPSGHPTRAFSLTQLSIHLSDRFRQFADIKDIEEAVVLARAALQLRPTGHRYHSISLNNLAYYLHLRYDMLGVVEDLDEAVALNRGALVLHPPGNLYRSMSLNNLAYDLHTRYEKLGAREDLDEAVALNRDALVLRPPGHPDRSMSLSNLANDLHTRYEKSGAVEDLQEAIALNRDALVLRPPGHPDRSMSLSNLANDLHTRYEKSGAVEDLQEAIALNRDALVLRPPGHADRSMSLSNLANDLHTRYEKSGAVEDLQEAIVLNRDALVLRPSGHPDRSMSLSNLANTLHVRHERLGVIEDLYEAIALNRDALALRPPGHPNRSMSLNNLANNLHTRYERLGATEDLSEAIVLNQDALVLRPPGHPDHSMSLTNLARNFHSRYKIFHTTEDLDEAITLNRRALILRPPGDPDRPMSLNNLAANLITRYRKLDAVEDLDEAIALHRDGLALRPIGHPDRSMSLSNLASDLCIRYRELGTLEDLDEAIVLSRDAVVLCPPGNLIRSQYLQTLTVILYTRLMSSHQSKDKEELFSLYTQLADIPQTVSSADLSATKVWIVMAEHFHHSTTLLSYETCLRLLIHHLATFPSLPRHLNLVKSLTSSLAVDAFSACLRNNSPAKAIELLEQGRGVFLNQLNRLRSPVDDVVASCPEGKTLADKFMQLTSLIRKAFNSPDADQHDRVCHLNVELQGVVSGIRRLPGLSRFLLPPLFSDLRKATVGGPVIIVNASEYSCDALIVLLDRDPVHIPLPITRGEVRHMTMELHRLTKLAKLMDVGTYFAGVLRELWEKVVSPIVDFLKTVHPFQSRIWWCPTAEFSLLPLHAAGAYRRSQPRFFDLYISSYTSTLAALIHTRRHGVSNDAAQRTRFVAIGQAKAKGESELHSVSTELANIGERVGEHTVFTRMEGPESSISQVIEALGKNEWVHLACHGLPNREQPFESAFGLYDGRLTIERIIQCDLEHPEFAYLSACHTTVGDKDCPDEMIHLASAMQFVGFRSVIGTMWAVDDEQTNKITSMFYDNMIDESGLDHTRAAFALHKTMREVKDISFDQRILYVHLGA